MKVLILAAGRSKRMQPVADKNFLEFMGKPLIVRQLEMLEQKGFDDIILVGGEHNLEHLCLLAKDFALKLEVIEQKDLDMGMCGAVLAAKDLLGNDPVLIFSSNDVVDESAFEAVKDAYGEDDADSYILGKKIEKYFPGGYLETDEHNFIHNIVEKPGEGNEPSDLVNLVVHVHKNPAKLVDYLEKVMSQSDDRYEVALSEMMKDGVKMKAVAYEGFWQPIKFPWHIQPVFEYFFEKAEKIVSKSADISKNAVINGDVIIGENVKIFDGAVVNGPAYIGDGTVIATNALVRSSHLGTNCVIGFSTEVARSFLGNDVWTHSNYIGDSVIGNDVSFGAGTVTGNLRLDEKSICVNCDDRNIDTGLNKFGLVTGDGVRVGVNTSFMPGVKVGGGSFVGAGLVVAESIPENSFVRGRWELKISENKANVDATTRKTMKNKLK